MPIYHLFAVVIKTKEFRKHVYTIQEKICMHIAYGSTYWYNIVKRIGCIWLKRIGDVWLQRIGFVCLFDLILYIPSTIFQLNRNGSSWVEPVLS